MRQRLRGDAPEQGQVGDGAATAGYPEISVAFSAPAAETTKGSRLAQRSIEGPAGPPFAGKGRENQDFLRSGTDGDSAELVSVKDG